MFIGVILVNIFLHFEPDPQGHPHLLSGPLQGVL